MKIEPLDFRYDEGFRGREDKDVSPSITNLGEGVGLSRSLMVKTERNKEGGDEANIRIRKLTPRECWRPSLMGFTDDDFDKAAKVCSDSRLYSQAGNSIVVDVLCAIFGQML